MMNEQQTIINLDQCVLNALELFTKKGIGQIETIAFKRPLIVGSGNAAVTGEILFAQHDAIFADESNYIEKLNAISAIDGVVIISASGAKHAPLIARELKKRNLPTILITNTENAPASESVDKTYVFPKNPEPYTYNTSTYLGMILAKTQEKPEAIMQVMKQIQEMIPADLSVYDAYYILLPNHLKLLREMFITKFDELFGPMVTGRVYTFDETKHAKTLVPSEKELFIALGYENNLFGQHRLNIPLSEQVDYGTALTVGYFIIGHIQRANLQYFKENVEQYVKKASEIFGETLHVIVE